jgi:membrane associated rhomboid family serine protease
MFPLYDTNPHHRVPWLTLIIIGINVAVMFWLGEKPDRQQMLVVAEYGFVPKRLQQLSDPKLVVEVNLDPVQENIPNPHGKQPAPAVLKLPADRGTIILSAFTMMFLHGGWWHLVGNMWFLWIFGNNIEDRLGHLIYGAFYLLGGLAALACHCLTDANGVIPVIGASGAVAAVLGAYAITYPTAKVRTLVFLFLADIPALIFLSLWFLQELAQAMGWLGGNEGGVAFWAHVGGFIAGIILMPLLALGAEPPDEDWRGEADSLFGQLFDEN